MMTRSLLIVCPFPEHHSIIEGLLDSSGWTINHAASAYEAADFLSENDPAALICERVLPDGGWEDVLQAIRDQGCSSALIVSSRLADNRLWSQVLNVGGFDVIGQPFDADELTRVLESALRSQSQAAAS